MTQSTAIAPAIEPFDPDADRLREECGVFGIFGHPDAAAITALGLHALQHRGQEAAGIVSFDGKRFHSERRMGLVGDNFSRREVIDRLPGTTAVGHVRYSTTGETILRNVQPLFAELEGGGFAIGHNGNLTNGLTLRRALVAEGAMMQSTTDTEVILHLVARARRNRFVDRFIEGLRQLEGAYAFVAMTNKKLIGARDPLGIRPLVLGKLDGCPVLASESCALDMIGATFVREVENGEVIVFDEEGVHSHKPFPPFKPKPLFYRQPIYYMSNHLTFVPSGAPVAFPQYSEALDYELEIGFVLQSPLFNATPQEALEAIGAFVVVNDLSARDVQRAEMVTGLGPQKAKHFTSSMSAVAASRAPTTPSSWARAGLRTVGGPRVPHHEVDRTVQQVVGLVVVPVDLPPQADAGDDRQHHTYSWIYNHQLFV